jgi:hypothetical protein
VIKQKARLMERGFVQQGVDFNDAFTPVTRMNQCASSSRWQLWQLNKDGVSTTWMSSPPSATVT